MEYEQWSIDDQREQVKGELKSFEQQHSQRSADAGKYAKLQEAHDRGDFKEWDTRVMNEKLREWKVQAANASIDTASMELLMADASARLHALEAKASKPDKKKGETP